MSKSEINVRPAISEDYKEIATGLEKWYWPYEPLSIGFHIKTPSLLEKAIFSSLPEEKEISLVASDPNENNKIIGFLVNAPNHPEIFAEITEKLQNSRDERFEAMFKLMLDLENIVNIFERFNIEKTFHLVAVAVDPSRRGQNIGSKLFQKSFLFAKSLGYEVVSVDCTSIYSTNIAKSLNMEKISSIEYKEYKDSEGNQIFSPPSEHTHITRFIKKL